MNWKSFIRENIHPMSPYAPGLRGSEIKDRCSREEILKISSNENPYGPFPRAIEAGKKIIEHLNRYPDGSSRDIRKRLSGYYGIDYENIVVGNGSNELLVHIGEACLEPGDEVVYCWPSFVVYRMVCQFTGATAVEVGLNADGAFDLEALAAAVTDKTKIVFLCNPNNPTGGIYRKEDFERFLAAVSDDVLICIDEAYAEYCVDECYPNGLDYFDGERPIVVLRTFSKIYALAGARIGWAAAPSPLIEAINKIREPFNVNTVAQAMAYYSLDDEAELDRRMLENANQRGRLSSVFSELGLKFVESHANFIYVYFDDPDKVFDSLLRAGVIVRNFGAGGALRIGVGTSRDTSYLIEVFRTLSEEGII